MAALFSVRRIKLATHKLSPMSRFSLVLLLLCLGGILVVFDSFSATEPPPPEPEDPVVVRAAQLDDPVGFKSHWLQQQGYKADRSIEAVARQQHSSAESLRAAQLKQPGVICTNTCFKANDGVCDEGRRGNLTLGTSPNWVYCDLGTDCADCGPWQGVQHGPAWIEGMGPIAYLQLYNIEVRVKQVPFEPNFMFAHTDPSIDSDQSAHVNATGVVEPGISQVFHKVLSKRCRRDAPGSQGLVVDVGGNYGWFALLSAALGCSVVSIEPVPIFRAFMEYSAARNHLTTNMEIIPAVVALNTTQTYTINAPLIKGAQWGASGMDVPHYPGAMQIPAKAVHLDDLAYPKRTSSLRAVLNMFGSSSSSDSGSSSDSSTTTAANTKGDSSSGSEDASLSRHLLGSIAGISSSSSATGESSAAAANADASGRQAESTDDAAGSGANNSSSSILPSSNKRQPVLTSRFLPQKLSEGIDILKVDVEGREPDVFATAERLLASGKVQNIIMEYSPGYYYQATDRLTDMPLLPALLMEFLRHNYSMVHIPWGIAHNAAPMKVASSWDTALPTMDAVTSPQLAYDLWTTEHIKNGTLPGMHGPSSWPCPEMAKSGMGYAEPGYDRIGMHILFHPKAFMSNFVFNTNIWASKDKSLQVPGTLLFNNRESFPFYYPSDSRWFPQAATSDMHQFGLPWAFCEHVPPKFQVAHRCRCRNWDVCGQHQVAVQQCVIKKHTGYDNLPDDKVAGAMARAAAIMAARRSEQNRR